MDKKHCAGCENNFYNGNNSYGVEKCWSLGDAVLMTRYQISMSAPMDIKNNYSKIKLPDCYRQKGSAYLNKIPDYAE